MSNRILVGIRDPDLARDATTLIQEGGGYTVAGVVDSTSEVLVALDGDTADIVILHDSLGPLPVLELAREIAARFPHVGMVLVARDQSPELLRTAMRAGVRAVTPLPLSLEVVQADLATAGGWSDALRARLAAGADEPDTQPANHGLLAVAGAKGGVGATTVAVHLAMAAVATTGQSVCLVDFDLQAGDVRAFLDLSHKRSVTDLLDAAEDLSPGALEEALYHHPSGLRVLLPPRDGEQAEDVREWPARQILAALRSRFDLVVVDVGAIVTEGSATAVEMADYVLLVTTPDAVAMRAANRLVALWQRLQVRKDGITVVLNRVRRSSEVQPDLAAKVLSVPLLPVTLPGAFPDLEAAVNTGMPGRLLSGSLHGALGQLAAHLGIAAPPRRRGLLRRRSDSGQVAVETLGAVPVVLLIVVMTWQLLLTGTTFVLAGHAAREGARVLAVDNPAAARSAAEQQVPAAWRDGMDTTIGTSGSDWQWLEVTLPVPVLFPGIDLGVRVPSRSGTFVERGLGP